MAGPIRWFVHNPIAANLLMVFLLVGGALAIPSLDKEFFPDFQLNTVSVALPYPGAGPSGPKPTESLGTKATASVPRVLNLCATIRWGRRRWSWRSLAPGSATHMANAVQIVEVRAMRRGR